ncbi:MAG: 2-dehydro-3-deoxy-6-phosphogalactonate aldolase [Lentisphaeria bacterium]|nr:2-dehydro-3-deoxy-6-phosphogalactonate aldolase [Lentisphaeria bacterium]
MKKRFEKSMSQCPVVAILRGLTTPEVPSVCDALWAAGITILEIPLNSPDPITTIAAAVKHCGERQMVGAGTVLTPENVRQVAEAGGKFIISPNTDVDVIRETKKCGLLSIPGFFTASEAFTAQKAGADYLKLFPAVLGPGYVKDLKAVVTLPILAVGGVNAANTPDFMKVCCGVGIGSAIYKAGRSAAEVESCAKEIVAKLK